MTFRNSFATLLFAAATIAIFAAAGSPDLPEVWPTCSSPQNAAPISFSGSMPYSGNDATVWNGREYAVVWPSGSSPYTLMFRRFFADGTPAGPIVPVGAISTNNTAKTAIVWTGSEYGVAWIAAGGATWQAYFTRLDRNGALLMTPLQVSFAGTAGAFNITELAMAGSASGYAVTWRDTRNGASNADVFVTLLTAAGAIAGAGASHDLPVSTDPGNQVTPVIGWSTNGIGYVAAWVDTNIVNWEIHSRSIDLNGALGSVYNVVNTPAKNPSNPALVAGAAGFGLVWTDTRDTNLEIYFTRISYFGSEYGVDTRVTNDANISNMPALAWTGAEFLTAWQDNRTGSYEIWLQRIASDSTLAGSAVRLTGGDFSTPALASSGNGFLVAAQSGLAGVFLAPGACQADATPPPCSGNYNAYNITGTSATVSWSPSTDAESPFAYYAVYRDNALVAKTRDEYYADSGLSLSGTYNYMIQPVNAYQLQNIACASSIYVRTNASLTLTMNKATTSDAGLNWTNANFNSYNIFRGNRPQVMSQTGSTPNLSSTDTNALTSSISYFYSVDNPGP